MPMKKIRATGLGRQNRGGGVNSTPTQWLERRAERLRTAASRGATLVEYALVFSLLVVVGLASYEFLTDRADAEIGNQADCVSDRPPPDGDCGFAPVPADVVTPDPNVAPIPIGPPGADLDEYTVSSGPADTDDDPWTLRLPVSVFFQTLEPPTEPAGIGGIRVRARVQMEDPNNPGNNLPDPGFTECITAADGECELEFTIPFDDVEAATLLVIGVDTPNPPDELPSLYTFTRN